MAKMIAQSGEKIKVHSGLFRKDMKIWWSIKKTEAQPTT